MGTRVLPARKPILLALFCLCPFLQGCVGFITATQQTETINEPVIASTPSYDNPADTREQARKRMVLADPTQATNRVDWVVYTPAWLQTHWGKPKRVDRPGAGADEVWTYHFGPIWEGVMPCLIVPVPLVLPVGEKTVDFTLRDGHVVSVSVTRAATGGVFWPKKL